jgi:uncharacterized protein YbcI
MPHLHGCHAGENAVKNRRSTMLRGATEDRQAVTARVSRAVVQIMKQNVGRGPTSCRTELHAGYAIVFCGHALTEAEKTLLSAGKRDQVKQARAILTDAIRDELVKAVETVTGRRVVSFASDVDPSADLAVNVFVFEPGLMPGSEDEASAQVNGR